MPGFSRHLKLLGAVALAALAALVVASCGGSKHKQTATTVAPATTTAKAGPPATQRPSLISIFGDPARLATSPGPALDTYRALGVDYVRATVPFAGLVSDPTASAPPAGLHPSSPSYYPADT